MSAGVGRGRGRCSRLGGQVKVAKEAAAAVGGGTASWGSGNLGAPLLPASTDSTEDSEQFLIDWDAINANREESERAR